MELEQIKEFVPFSELQDEYLHELYGNIEVKHFNKGEMLFKRGRPAEFAYYLLSGQVDLIAQSFEREEVKAESERSKCALNPDNPTVASGVTKSDVTVFTVSTDILDRVMTWSESAASVIGESSHHNDGEFHVEEISQDTVNDWMSALLQSPLLSRVPMAQVQELFMKFDSVPVKKGESIIKEGETGDYFYVLSSGKAHVTNASKSVDIELSTGSFFGEEALLGNTLRNASVTMLTDGVLKRLNKENFSALLKEPVIRYIEQDKLETLTAAYQLIDVKTPIEFRVSHPEGSINIPLAKLRSKFSVLDASVTYLVTNDCGARADIAAHLLCQAGFDAVVLNTAASDPE